jgi:hypothetical protein
MTVQVAVLVSNVSWDIHPLCLRNISTSYMDSLLVTAGGSTNSLLTSASDLLCACAVFARVVGCQTSSPNGFHGNSDDLAFLVWVFEWFVQQSTPRDILVRASRLGSAMGVTD